MYRTVKRELEDDLKILKALGIPLDTWVYIEDDIYHNQAPGISASGLKKIHSASLATYRFAKDQEEGEKGEALIVGGATHKFILENDIFFDEYAFSESSDKRKPQWKADKKKADEDGLTLLRATDKNIFDGMLDSLKEERPGGVNTYDALIANPDAVREMAIFAVDKERQILLKVKTDINIKGMMLDLKSTKSAKPKNFMKDAANLGYSLQAAFYLRVAKIAKQPSTLFGFIAIEKEAPYLHENIIMPEHVLKMEEYKINKLLDMYSVAYHTGEWTGYTVKDPETGHVPLYIMGEFPGWYIFQLEEENEFKG